MDVRVQITGSLNANFETMKYTKQGHVVFMNDELNNEIRVTPNSAGRLILEQDQRIKDLEAHCYTAFCVQEPDAEKRNAAWHTIKQIFDIE